MYQFIISVVLNMSQKRLVAIVTISLVIFVRVILTNVFYLDNNNNNYYFFGHISQTNYKQIETHNAIIYYIYKRFIQ